ncbi:MAG: winged helix DNA-binding protein [Oscillospiraceae bacterium]|nr:winged helix DNA-binding protein [Oscillospiraceae bacterium]
MVKSIKKSKNTPVSLAVDIAKLFDAQMRVEMLRNGARTSYKQILHSLSRKDGVTQLDLVKVTKLKAPTISTTLRNMETAGLVRRETDKDDARATRVYITEKGRETDKKIRSSKTKIEKAFHLNLSAEEKEQLIILLGKMKENISISADELPVDES